jgi:hypothetical protein
MIRRSVKCNAEMFKKEDVMEIPLVLLMVLLVLDGAAWRWGFDSRDSWNSAEWDRRRSWQAFH